MRSFREVCGRESRNCARASTIITSLEPVLELLYNFLERHLPALGSYEGGKLKVAFTRDVK
jgi:hypothetical protein